MRRQQGITLTGVLVALAVLAVGLVSLGAFQAGTLRETGLVKQRSAALVNAQNQIDQMRDFAQAGDLQELSSGSDTITLDGVTYTRSWTVVPQADGSQAVTLTVAWPDPQDPAGGASSETTLTLHTVISNYLPATEAATVLAPAAPVTLTTTACSGSGMMGGCGGMM